MPSGPAITFYDIPTRHGLQAWSANTWKIRLVLNYKRIPYKTIWISYPEIKETVESIGAKPTFTSPDGELIYTLPTILDTSSGSPIVVTDSSAIAEYLDAKYPGRPVLPQDGKALQYAFEATVLSTIGPHYPTILLFPMWKLMDDRSGPYIRETRERWFGNGKKLEDFSPEGPVREGHWKAYEQAWDEIAAILDKNGPGVNYVAGGTNPTLADMIIVSQLAMIVAILPEDWEKRIKHWSGGRWEKLWKLTEEWRDVPL